VNRGVATWILFYSGTVILVWAARDIWAAITYLAGLGVAVATLLAVDYLMRER